MTSIRIKHVRAYIVQGGGADYHEQGGKHWIDDRIASPMSIYPEYRTSRRSFGIDVLGSLIVEIEATNGVVGFAVTTAGEPGAFIVEKHFARFIEGAVVSDIGRMWDQMYKASMYYGRRGLVLNVISCVDLALYDLLGKIQGEPVYALIGGKVRDELTMYATGARPDRAAELGFAGGKSPLHFGPDDGPAGIAQTVSELESVRNRVGPDFFLMLDCWMSLNVEHAVLLADALRDLKLKWIEEPLSPDDYWGHSELRQRMPSTMLLASGEHEATRWGFRQLIEYGRVDIIQPDVTWCGGMTELRRIAAVADAHGIPVIPHGSSVYAYHFCITHVASPLSEFIMMDPDASKITPMFSPLLLDEPVPVGGRLGLSDAPGFGVSLNPEIELTRPYRRP